MYNKLITQKCFRVSDPARSFYPLTYSAKESCALIGMRMMTSVGARQGIICRRSPGTRPPRGVLTGVSPAGQPAEEGVIAGVLTLNKGYSPGYSPNDRSYRPSLWYLG